MPDIKLERVVSASSEDPSQKAENLLQNSGGRKWRCENPGEQQVSAVIKLSAASRITSIDIGNNGSAFVEVQVGKEANQEFKVILVASSFLSPLESRNESNMTRVRMFSTEKLSADVAKEKWDQIKIVCTQPFNKHIKYGISFISLHTVGAEKDGDSSSATPSTKKLGAFKLKDDEDDTTSGVGSLFASTRGGSIVEKLKKEKESVATALRSEATLASMALQSEEASRKRKALDNSREFYQLQKDNNTPKKPRRESSTSNGDKKLPRRDVLPGEQASQNGGGPSSSRDTSTPKAKDNKKSTTPAKKRPLDASVAKKSDDKPVKSKEKAKKTRAFNKLMEDVVFCISGIQNPLRGDVRQKAIEMGARYKGDWDGSCTHLICAFVNTPKFNQVKGKGKIVRKEWIEKSHENKKRFPWRRYCLDNGDKGDSSEDEVWDESLVPAAAAASPQIKQENDEQEEMDTDDEIENAMKNVSSPSKNDAYDQDTDDEIEQVKLKKSSPVKKESNPFEEETDDEVCEKNSDDAYEADTDVDDDDNSKSPVKKEKNKNGGLDFPPLPEYFSGINFMLYGSFDTDEVRKSIVRGVVAAGGQVRDYMGPDVHYVITNNDWDASFKDALKVNKKVIFVRPSYVEACFQADDLVKHDAYTIKNE